MSVQTTRRGPVTHITLNNPDKRNAFDNTIIETLIDAFQQAGGDDGRVIVLDAAGKHFSAGADLNWMRAMGALDEQENRADDSDVSQRLIEYTANLIAELRTGAEGQEGLGAFLEKRPPNWKPNRN